MPRWSSCDVLLLWVLTTPDKLVVFSIVLTPCQVLAKYGYRNSVVECLKCFTHFHMASSQDRAPAPTLPPAPLRLFVVDDHAVVLAGLIGLLSAEPDMTVVGHASDGESAVRQIANLQPPHSAGMDIVILDVEMSPGDGKWATREIKRRWPSVKVLVLSMHEDRAYLRNLLDAGASGYVLKRSPVNALIRAVRAVHRGHIYLDPSFSPDQIASHQKPKYGEGFGNPLTVREEEVLRLVAQGQPNKEVAATLFLSTKTIEAHKTRALAKLELGSRVELVRYALAQGWL